VRVSTKGRQNSRDVWEGRGDNDNEVTTVWRRVFDGGRGGGGGGGRL